MRKYSTVETNQFLSLKVRSLIFLLTTVLLAAVLIYETNAKNKAKMINEENIRLIEENKNLKSENKELKYKNESLEIQIKDSPK